MSPCIDSQKYRKASKEFQISSINFVENTKKCSD